MPEAGGAGASSWSDVRVRVLPAAVLAMLALATAWAGGPVFILFWASASAIVLCEWWAVSQPPSVRSAPIWLAVATLWVAAVVCGWWWFPDWTTSFVSATLVIAVVMRAAGFARWDQIGAPVVATFLLSMVSIRRSPAHGFDAVIWLFIVVWATDVGAYFVGRAFGGPKLWPAVSPKKTWSGALGGALAGALGGAIVLRGADLPATPPALAFGLAAAIVSQGGDLLESHLKRLFGVKDSSNLIPGHGGLMDRLDGFVAAAVVAAAVGWLRGGPNVAEGMLRW